MEQTNESFWKGEPGKGIDKAGDSWCTLREQILPTYLPTYLCTYSQFVQYCPSVDACYYICNTIQLLTEQMKKNWCPLLLRCTQERIFHGNLPFFPILVRCTLDWPTINTIIQPLICSQMEKNDFNTFLRHETHIREHCTQILVMFLCSFKAVKHVTYTYVQSSMES
jgi:hypothetical protein